MRVSELQAQLATLAEQAAACGSPDPEVVIVYDLDKERPVAEAWIRQPPGERIQIAIEAGE